MPTIFQRTAKKKLTPESEWRQAGLQWLKIRFGRNLWHLRTVAGITQRFGVLDDHFIIRGIPVQVEWKRADGKYRRDTATYRAQELEIESVIAAGGRAGFVESWDDLEELVSGIEAVQISMTRRGGKA